MPRLVIFSGGATGREFPLKGPCIIGRQTGNSLVLEGDGISRQHCKVFPSNGRWAIQDMGSANGTFVNGEQLSKGIFLKDNDEILIGDAALLYKELGEDATPKGGDVYLNKVINGYKIQEKTGDSAYGATYKARQLSMSRDVSFRVLSKTLTSDAAYIKRFLQEAAAAARLNHQNLIRVYDAGVQGQTYYYSMELVTGRNLGEVLQKQNKLPVPFAVAMVKQIAEALAHAHAQKVLHLDIRPGNIILTEDSVAKLADIGLSRRQETSGKAGGFEISPLYLSPEQARGEKADARSDLYALGATLYHLITGQPVFLGKTTLSILTQHISAPPPSPREINPEISEGLSKILLKLLAKEPGERYQKAEELAEALSDPRILAAGSFFAGASADRVSQFSERVKEHGQVRRKAKIQIHRIKARPSRRNAILGVILIAALIVAAIVLFFTAFWADIAGNAKKLEKQDKIFKEEYEENKRYKESLKNGTPPPTESAPEKSAAPAP